MTTLQVFIWSWIPFSLLDSYQGMSNDTLSELEINHNWRKFALKPWCFIQSANVTKCCFYHCNTKIVIENIFGDFSEFIQSFRNSVMNNKWDLYADIHLSSKRKIPCMFKWPEVMVCNHFLFHAWQVVFFLSKLPSVLSTFFS